MTSDYKVRPGDTPRSWTVLFLREGPTLTQSNWAPGYTSAHKHTKIEAIAQAFNRTNAELKVLDDRLSDLRVLAVEAAREQCDDDD